ncbi:DinB family protein [Ulvibacter antarcticus]|uniref:Putative damage-inducible protein DinB n=1 Tax=Ulvibacter antarcticus TaxID=442714 RepID=A0A3L9YBJ5_9FLAO|nr:DinB family protein [Ulvibacter antarcticus]RMA58046.1 putative damage-inducible protein DinB [Ulvibacter antarcticus]
MKAFFKEKFEYNHQCNEKVINQIIENSNAYSDKVATLISHSLIAHEIWNSRILKLNSSTGVWDKFPTSELIEINQINFEASQQIVRQFEVEEVVSYINTKGKTYENSVADILFHIINHSTYHRGQIVSALKLEGVSPAVTDYIFFKR